MVERDPHGLDPHAPGAKLDAGKARPGMVLGGFARALLAVAEVGTYGAAKYSDNGWTAVPGGRERYDDAGMRHRLARWAGEERDRESQLLHLAHEAWNALAVLELELRNAEAESRLTTAHQGDPLVGRVAEGGASTRG